MASSTQPDGDDAMALTLLTLGASTLYAETPDAPLLGPGKPLALVIFLAFAPGRRCSRDTLVDLLWSDLDPERARPALRQTLFLLRRFLGDDAIVGTEELTLAFPIHTDRDRFLAALDAGDLETASAEYRGAFLPAFGVPGGAAFEHWADLERDRLETGFVRCGELLVRRHLNASRMKEARQLARRVRDLVPHAEATGRLVLEASVASRDFVAAAMEADVIEQWALREDVILEPATRAALARARRIAPVVDDDRSAAALVAELTGREQEFFAITSAWDGVRTGAARHLHVSAPAGLGKTRLLRDAMARLTAAGAHVVQLRGIRGDRDVPFAFVGDLAAAIAQLPGAGGIAPASASTLVALNPALSTRFSGTADTATGDDALRRRILALTDLLHSVAHEQRFVFSIDDLHWIDAASFRVLEAVLGRLGDARILCVSASRPERVPVNDGCTQLVLSPLTVAQLAALVSGLGVVPAGDAWGVSFVPCLFEATRGSPLLILETLRLALDSGVLSLEEHEWRCHDPARLLSLLQAGEALRERVRALPATQSWLLALIAVAGTSMEHADLATVAGMSPADLAAQLDPLERNGFIVRAATGWIPSHDEIAEVARESLTHDARTTAEQCIGQFLARAAGDDHSRLLRAVRHLVAAGDVAAVSAFTRTYARRARQRGDKRPFPEIIAELVGADATSQQVTALVAQLPRAWRIGLWSRTRQMAAVVAVAVAPVLGLSAMRARTTADANLQQLFFVDSAQTTVVIPIRAEEFDGRNTSLERRAGNSTMSDAAIANQDFPPFPSPDGRALAWSAGSGDSTIQDIWLRTPAGTRRLTYERGDDVASGWLPDGSALIGVTQRWTPRDTGNYDVAVFDTATGAARQITHGPEFDTTPFISPDGTRIAFARRSDAIAPRVCLTTIDGRAEPVCHLLGRSVAQILGWSSLNELVVIVEEADGSRHLVVHDWVRNTQRSIVGPHAVWGRLSPDRRWVLATTRINGIDGDRDWVAPLDHPANARPLGPAKGGFGMIRWWEGPPDQSALIDHIEFSDTSHTMLLGVPTQLRIRPLTATRVEVPVLAPVYWTSSDTRIATVDSSGSVIAHAVGSVTIHASLVGWRNASIRLNVRGAPAVTVLTETWGDDWQSRWIPWGYPRPFVTVGPAGIRGFFNNGDATYENIGLSKAAFTATAGLGVEIRISSPIPLSNRQRLEVAFASGFDTTAAQTGDQSKSWPQGGRTDSRCGINFPGEGRWAENIMAMSGGIGLMKDLGDMARPLRSGAWWTLRLQILPDGRCGVAINNRVVWISADPLVLAGDFRIRLGVNSFRTKILHGPLQVWTGVRTDVDWRVVPSVNRGSP